MNKWRDVTIDSDFEEKIYSAKDGKWPRWVTYPLFGIIGLLMWGYVIYVAF